eukprot:UN17510
MVDPRLADLYKQRQMMMKHYQKIWETHLRTMASEIEVLEKSLKPIVKKETKIKEQIRKIEQKLDPVQRQRKEIERQITMKRARIRDVHNNLYTSMILGRQRLPF